MKEVFALSIQSRNLPLKYKRMIGGRCENR
jgi:hypothetical protein